MKGYIIFLMVLLLSSCSKYKGEKDSIAYDIVEITFDGYGEYEIEGNLKMVVTNPEKIKELNRLKNHSQRKWFANVKGTEYVVRLVYTDVQTNDKLLLRILKSTDASPTIEYGPGTIFDGKYENNELVSYVAAIFNFEAIKQYEGSLSQEEYEKFILKAGH